MNYPFTNAPRSDPPLPGVWLSSLTGKEYSKFITGLRTAVVDFETDSENFATANPEKIRHDAPLMEANSVASLYIPRGAPKNADGIPTHKPVLDIDMPVMLVPSSTRGHNHLYIDAPMSWDHYAKLLKVLGEVGILEPGYVRASLYRESTWLRLPWIGKG